MYEGPHCACNRSLRGDLSTALPGAIGGAASGVSTGLAVAAAAGGPIGAAVGAAIFGLSALFGGIFGTSKIGIEKQRGTQLVNEAEPLLVANVQKYQASQHTIADQTDALAYFDSVWAQVVAGCQQNSPDRNECYTDRQRGGKFDWFARYRDPIAKDANVKQGVFSTVGVDTSGVNWGLVLGIGVLGIGLLLPDGNKR